MKKLRLLMTEQCNRDCEGCCNKDWNLNELPIWDSDILYDLIMITGGEPMLFPNNVSRIANHIHTKTPTTKVYLYTALPSMKLIYLLQHLDGITLTLHENADIKRFKVFDKKLKQHNSLIKGKSFRLNVFKGVDLKDLDLSLWDVKDNIEWIDDCPLPENEEFMQI